MEVRSQIRDVGVGQSGAIGGHAGTARLDLGRDPIIAQAFDNILQVGTALGVLVVAHPTFIEVDHFTASRTAVGNDGVVIQPP